ncbi:MAG: 5'-3' exonuclease H3TH domain-containing protein, partial [Phycisphaerales bacterium]|nr:5'-3' exonuclease H3TH domain-containing protein [Phycisphaerales bacterium]
PGIPGIGPKTASKLILQYGSIEGIYEHLDEIKGKRRENLEGAEERLHLNRELVQLRDDLDFDFDLESARYDPTELPIAELRPLLRELDFRRAPDRLASILAGARGGEDTSMDAGTLWADHDDDGQL